MIDLIYVTYNSEKWIEECFMSIINSDYSKQEINLIVVDNASSDNTINLLKEFRNRYFNILGGLQIIENSKNEGFGKANNIGFSYGKSDIVCFLNIDTVLFPDTLMMLKKEIEYSKEDIAVWEMRQFPYEHPKLYDPLSGETGWVSGAAFAIKRNVFEAVGKFDSQIFMYAEDVDLSWRIRGLGYKLKYVPTVRVNHFSYEDGQMLKINQHVYGMINNLLLRYRFGGFKDVLVGHLIYWRLILLVPEQVEGAKRLLLKEYVKHFRKIMHFWNYGRYKKKNGTFKPCFYGIDYSENRIGAFYKNSELKKQPLVSIIVRTCNRPQVLREALLSIKNQTYTNIEVVVVEDGYEAAKDMIEQEFSEMSIRYFSTGEKVGRSRAGNIGISRALGQYINFLDDDDLFFNDHVEVLVNALEKSDKKAVYGLGLETAVLIKSFNPYEYVIKTKKVVYQQKFDKIMLCHHNFIPIQCIMFCKELFDLYGGLDEGVHALEDWDLWVRYSLYTDFEYINKVTSIYRVPFDEKKRQNRQKDLDLALEVMREKHKGYLQHVDVRTLALLYENSSKK